MTSILGTPLPAAPLTPLRLAIVEDDPAVRELLHRFLSRSGEFECVAVVDSIEALWRELDLSLPPTLILLDLGLPGQNGLDALPELARRLPGVGILVQTMHDDAPTIYQALRSGARGYVVKGATSLAGYRQALFDVALGGSVVSPSVARKLLPHFAPTPTQQPELLSAREREMLDGLIAGLSEKQIAAKLDLSSRTVRTYIERLYEKLRVRNRAELLGRAARDEL